MISSATNSLIQDALASGRLGAATRPEGGKVEESSFSQQLMDVLGEVEGAQQKAASAQTDLTTGRRQVEVHDVMIEMEKASMAMQLTLQVRNKLLEGYQEISRMQV